LDWLGFVLFGFFCLVWISLVWISLVSLGFGFVLFVWFGLFVAFYLSCSQMTRQDNTRALISNI